MVWAGSVPARYYSAPLGSARLPLTSGSGLFRSPRGGRAAASPAHALSVPAAFRTALYFVFSLPSLRSCIRVVAFPIV